MKTPQEKKHLSYAKDRRNPYGENSKSSRTAIRGGSKFIRPVFILVVLALTARLAWQHWFTAAA